MSYDVYLTIDSGAEEWPTVVEIGNYTSNVSPMWRDALGKSLADSQLAMLRGCGSARPGG